MAAGKTLETNKTGFASDMNTIGQWGLATNIPATGDVVAGSFYYETDTKLLKQEQNGSWVDISGADLSTADAVVGDVKSGKTFFSVTKPVKTGTVPWNKEIVAGSDLYEEGYHAGNVGGLDAIDTDLAPANIKKDVVIFGKVGTYEEIIVTTALFELHFNQENVGTVWETIPELAGEVPANALKVQIVASARTFGGVGNGDIQILYNSVQKATASISESNTQATYWEGEGLGSAAELEVQLKIDSGSGFVSSSGGAYYQTFA